MLMKWIVEHADVADLKSNADWIDCEDLVSQTGNILNLDSPRNCATISCHVWSEDANRLCVSEESCFVRISRRYKKSRNT
jgi:hypothetical protein